MAFHNVIFGKKIFMNTASTSSAIPASKLLYAGLLVAGSAGFVLLSPKWVVPVFAWIAPACLLFYFRHATIRLKVLLFIAALLIAEIISSYEVAPFPLAILAIISTINVMKVLLVFLIDKWVTKRTNSFISTFIFPAAFVTKEYFDVISNGGAWLSIANTQYTFSWLAQITSVTGLLGISFLIYWFAAIAVWSTEKFLMKEKFLKGVWVYASVFLIVLVFGAMRFYSNELSSAPSVKIAGLSVPNTSILESLYKDVYHKDVFINPKTSPSSKELQEVNTALIPFIENPDSIKFANSYKALYQLHDSLFALSEQAADKGAKIIEWSEGNAIMITSMQDAFIKRGEEFAAKNKVYLLMALAVFEPGKITPERLFLENKTILVGDDGKILNVFHKNYPVPFAERSKPGDGKIPEIQTPYGKISVSICYDADIVNSMQQLGKNKSDVLLLPSGDWYAIAPYHSYMAMFRGIENGTTIVRQVSGGLSLATDYRGRKQASFNFFEEGQKLWVADISIGHVTTVYTVIGDALAYVCMLITAISLVHLLIQKIIKKKAVKKIKTVVQRAA